MTRPIRPVVCGCCTTILSRPEPSYPGHPKPSYPGHPKPVEGWRLRSGSSFDRLRMAVDGDQLRMAARAAEDATDNRPAHPIGIFDSGLGGLTVAREVLRRLPDEAIAYFADTVHVPYGERPLAQIEEFALGIAGFLVDRGAKAVVMACNMSSAVALHLARDAFPGVPILGVIDPGSRAALAQGGRVIGVLATTGTVKSGAYRRTIQALDPNAEVHEQACPAFVPLVEAGLADTEEAEIAARNCVEPLVAARVDTLILGCTHYPFLRPVIARAAPGVRIVDPAEETVRELQNVLAEDGTLADQGQTGEHTFFASGNTDGFARLGSSFLGRQINKVERVQWGVDLQPGRCGTRNES